MVVPISNSKNYVICPFCGSPELLSGLSGEQANNEIRTCTYCGQEINTKKKEREKDGETNLLENIYSQMNFLTYREIYHILKNTKLLEKNAKSLDLTEFEISKIVDQARRETINGSFLVDLKEKFPRGQFPQVRRLYQEIREEQQQEQLFNDEHRILFEEATMDLFSIICGDQNYHDLSDIQKRIVTNIIQEDGFNPEDKDDNYSFKQQAWLLAAFYIHHILVEREKVSHSNLKLILSPIRINEISQEFTDFFTGDLILEKWDWRAIKLKKSRFDKELMSLQINLKRDWIFRESFVAQAKRLIMFISQLIRGEIDINLVKDLEKKIVDKLIHDLNIDNNSRISSIFKFNFMLVITRFVYFILRAYPDGPPLGENLMESEDPIEQKFTWYIKREMLKSESFDASFLKNLHELEISDFNEVFSTIRRDMKNDFIFSMSFNGYLESMITRVINLISSTKKKSRHSLDELAIIENLANYNFQWKMREITDEEIDEDVIEKDHLRTYKVGLRASESLFTGQNELAIELEVLQHFHKEIKGNKSTSFDTKLSNCSKENFLNYFQKESQKPFVYFVDQVDGEANSLTPKLYEFLDSKKADILTGKFSPSKYNIISERSEFKNFKEINNRIAKWLKKNTTFTGIRQLREHFEGKESANILKEFLESKKDDLLEGKFFPNRNNIISEIPELEDYEDLHVIVYRWLKNNTPFNSLTELKEHFLGIPLAQQLRNYLDLKKSEILTGEFVPNKKNIIAECPEYEGYDTYHIVFEWLKKNTQYERIAELEQDFFGDSVPMKIREILNNKKIEILNGNFIPTKDNLKAINIDIGDYNHTNDVINNWLEEHSKFKKLTELIDHFDSSRYDLHPETIRDKIRKFLDQKHTEIFSGQFLPTTKNIRLNSQDLGNYTYLSRVVSDWINEESNSRFKNLDEIIEHFNPYPNSLGHKGRHGYTANFESLDYRIKNAINQTVRIITISKLITLVDKNLPKSWNAFFNFLKKKNDWKFVDMLTGEIFTKKDILKGKFAFHHIDRNKDNDDENNLCFMLHYNHSVITLAQIYYPVLATFFEDVLKKNITSINNGLIPQSWKYGWRSLATKERIKIPLNRYKMKLINKTILEFVKNKKDLNKWL